jgi:hypothetical protein
MKNNKWAKKLKSALKKALSTVTIPFRYSNILDRKPLIPFNMALPDLQTGDIFLARGKAPISRFIETLSRCNWSHVGIIVLPQDIGIEVEGNPPHLWESTTHDDVKHLLSKGEEVKGPMLVDLAKRMDSSIKSKDYEVFGIRYIQRKLTEDQKDLLADFIKRVHEADTTFPEISDMVKDVLKHRAMLRAVPVAETYYCSQLAAATYQSIKLLPLTPEPKSYIPRDYSAKGYAPFLGRLTFGPEIFLGAPEKADTQYEYQRDENSETERYVRVDKNAPRVAM